MKRLRILAILITVIFILLSCDFFKDLIIIPHNIYNASTDSSYVFYTDPRSIEIEASPIFEVSRDTLGENGISSSYANDLFEFTKNSIWDRRVLKEFIINPDDSFRVFIKNCIMNREWNFCIDDIENFIISKNSIPSSDSTYDCLYTFIPKEHCKGYIGFFEYEENAPGTISSFSPGFIIGYTVDFLSLMTIGFEEINWIYGLQENWSDLAVSVKGFSNAYKLKIETYGDGVLDCVEIPKDEDGNFDFKTGISFSHGVSDSLETNTRIALYGAPGDPKLLILKNPLSEE